MSPRRRASASAFAFAMTNRARSQFAALAAARSSPSGPTPASSTALISSLVPCNQARGNHHQTKTKAKTTMAESTPTGMAQDEEPMLGGTWRLYEDGERKKETEKK